MKIGVLTYHCVPNFGAQLQALSTIGFLRRMGHEAVLLHWYAKDLEEMYSSRIPSEQFACQALFAETHFPLSYKCQSEAELIDVVNGLHLDAIVAGSDALFKYIPLRQRRHFSIRRLKYVYHFTPLSCELIDKNPFFGDFLSRINHRIPAAVYAASSQNCPYHDMNYWERKKMADALSNYCSLSARDTWTQQMLQKITGKTDIQKYPDPVFSFNQNSFLPIPTKVDVCEKFGIAKDYVLFSFSDWFVSQEYIKAIAEETENRGLLPIALPMPEKLNDAGIIQQISLPLSPLWWYALIIHSRGYIGERMHPIVVCLHNSIPFYCFDEYGTGVRISCFSKKKSFDINSSKTYAIVSEAGLEKNLHSYKGNSSLPVAKCVLDNLLTFEVEKCRRFAQKKQEEYEQGMSRIISQLSNCL